MLALSCALSLGYHAGVSPAHRPRARLHACAQGPSPESWREFRAKLIEGGLKVTEEDDGGTVAAEAAPAPATEEVTRLVAPKNVELLKEQNKALWDEYMSGVWAHASPVEAGGLLVRVPPHAQLTYQMRNKQAASYWSDALRERLRGELPKEEEPAEAERLMEQWSANTLYCYRWVAVGVRRGWGWG